MILTFGSQFYKGVKGENPLIAPIPMNFFPPNSPQTKPPTLSLEQTVQQSLEGTEGTYSVVVKGLNGRESYFLNEHQTFETGSLYKLWIMAVVFDQLEQKTLTEEQILSQDITVLNNKFQIEEDLAELTEGGITLSVGSALNQMITISHNYAALLLTEKIKLSSVTSFLKQNGLNESRVGTSGEAPTSTAFDMALFYQKLYEGELGNQDSTSKMIELLKKQQLNDKLPRNLPPGTSVAHKTGEIGYFSHDAGIVYTPKGDYIIVVLSQSNSPVGADARIAQVSQAVYQFFTQK